MCTTHRCVGGKGVDKDIIERDILGTDEEVGPAGGVELGDTLDRHAGSVVCREQNGTVEDVIRVLDYPLAQVTPSSFEVRCSPESPCQQRHCTTLGHCH